MRYAAALVLLVAFTACDRDPKVDKEPNVVDTIPPHVEPGGVPSDAPEAPPLTPEEKADLDSITGAVESPAEEVSFIPQMTDEIFHLAATRFVDVPFSVAPDSLVWLKTKVYVRNMKANDRLAYTYFKDTSMVKRNIKTGAKDSVQAAAPDYGQKAVYKGCVQIWYGGDSTKVFPAEPSCWTWEYTRPATPPATIDSVVRLALRSQPLVPGGPWERREDQTEAMATDSNRVQFCAYVKMKDSTWKKTSNADGIPICENLYQQLLSERTG